MNFNMLMNKFKLLLSVSRPIIWISGPLIILAGIVYSGGNITPMAFLQMVLLTFPAGVITFGINDVYDYKSDKMNPRKKHIEGIKLKPKYHKFVLNSALFSSILLLSISLWTKNITNIIGVSGLLFFSYIYSAPPIRLKKRPPLDSFSNGAIVLSVFLIGFSYGKTLYQIDNKILFSALCVAGFHTFTTVLDYKYDKKAKDMTFAVKFGKRTALMFSLLILLITIMYGNFSRIILDFLIFCTILSFIAFIYPREKIVRIFTWFIYAGIIITATLYLLLFFS